MHADRNEINGLSGAVIGCAFTVLNALGAGFLEKVYENALAHEIRKRGLNVAQQHPVRCCYDSIIVGEYFADMLVEDRLIIELKVAKAFEERPVPELPQGNRSPTWFALEFRQAAVGNQTYCQRPMMRSHDLRALALICRHPRSDSFFHKLPRPLHRGEPEQPAKHPTR
jgi:GxxExxY protein